MDKEKESNPKMARPSLFVRRDSISEKINNQLIHSQTMKMRSKSCLNIADKSIFQTMPVIARNMSDTRRINIIGSMAESNASLNNESDKSYFKSSSNLAKSIESLNKLDRSHLYLKSSNDSRNYKNNLEKIPKNSLSYIGTSSLKNARLNWNRSVSLITVKSTPKSKDLISSNDKLPQIIPEIVKGFDRTINKTKFIRPNDASHAIINQSPNTSSSAKNKNMNIESSSNVKILSQNFENKKPIKEHENKIEKNSKKVENQNAETSNILNENKVKIDILEVSMQNDLNPAKECNTQLDNIPSGLNNLNEVKIESLLNNLLTENILTNNISETNSVDENINKLQVKVEEKLNTKCVEIETDNNNTHSESKVAFNIKTASVPKDDSKFSNEVKVEANEASNLLDKDNIDIEIRIQFDSESEEVNARNPASYLDNLLHYDIKSSPAKEADNHMNVSDTFKEKTSSSNLIQEYSSDHTEDKWLQDKISKDSLVLDKILRETKLKKKVTIAKDLKKTISLNLNEPDPLVIERYINYILMSSRYYVTLKSGTSKVASQGLNNLESCWDVVEKRASLTTPEEFCICSAITDDDIFT